MDADRLYDGTTSLGDAENRLALDSGALLLLVGASRRSLGGASGTPAVSRHHGISAGPCEWLRSARQHQDGPRRTDDFVAAIAKHRHFASETDPPRV